MKYHLLVYDGRACQDTMESIENQDVRRIDFSVSYLQKQYRAFKKGALYAYYTEIMQIPDNEVVILLKGGSSFAHSSVIKEVDRLYTEQKALMTYGGDMPIYDGIKEGEINLSDILNRNARGFSERGMDLKTFYAGLFKKIRLTDLLVDGFFLEEGFDYPLMLPMLEMAEERAVFSKDILHISSGYRVENKGVDLLKYHPYSAIDNIT